MRLGLRRAEANPEIELKLLLGRAAAAVFARWLQAGCAQAQADAAAWLAGLACASVRRAGAGRS